MPGSIRPNKRGFMKKENIGLCPHVQFTKKSRAFPGNEKAWRAYLAAGGLATTTKLLAREHAGECDNCATLLAMLDRS
jgi:hypothetical protein